MGPTMYGLQTIMKNNRIGRMVAQKDIIEYYVTCEDSYKDVWGLRRNMQLNLGIWDKKTKTLGQAMQNLNQKIAQSTNVDKSCTLLDAGCGVGGTTIYMSREFGSICHGIGIVPSQIKQCKENALRQGVSDKTEYQVMDYTRTTFPDGLFDAVIGIESICHADSKTEFLKEAHRILKPGGRLVIVDPLQSKENLSSREYKTLYDNSFNGCAVSELWTADHYLTTLEKLGYKAVDHTDFTPLIRQSIVRLRKLYYPAWFYNQYRAIIGKPFSQIKTANTRMCYYLLTALNQNLWTYGMIRGIK